LRSTSPAEKGLGKEKGVRCDFVHRKERKANKKHKKEGRGKTIGGGKKSLNFCLEGGDIDGRGEKKSRPSTDEEINLDWIHARKWTRPGGRELFCSRKRKKGKKESAALGGTGVAYSSHRRRTTCGLPLVTQKVELHDERSGLLPPSWKRRILLKDREERFSLTR